MHFTTLLLSLAALLGPPQDFGDYHALVIGNNAYQQQPKLKTAVTDAKAVAKQLRADGLSLRKIDAELESRGIMPRTAPHWSAAVVRGIIKRRAERPVELHPNADGEFVLSGAEARGVV